MSGETDVSQAERQLREIVEQLRAEGWHVETQPDTSSLPGVLRGFRVDFVANRDQDIVIGEVADRGSARQKRINALAKQVAAIPNARLEVYWTGDTPVTKPVPESVRQYIVEANMARKSGSLRAALLMALAAFEGSIATLADEAGIRLRAPARQLLSNLYSLGYVDDADFSRLTRLYAMRNAISHLATSQVPEPEDVEFCLELAERMLNGHYVSVDRMIEWFEEHYFPFGSREGGPQHGKNDPIKVEAVLQRQFPYASDEALEDAADWLESESKVWTRKTDTEGNLS